MKRFGLKPPSHWALFAAESFEAARSKVPRVIIRNKIERAWSASLFGGEGCIAANYSKIRDYTFLVTAIRMTDKDWVDHFALLVGVPHSGRRSKGPFKAMWDKTLSGLRALRFLTEILPYLYGSKKAEAMRAIEFFSPSGYRSGKHSSLEIWPKSEFPLRKRPLTSRSYARSKKGSSTESKDKLYHRPG